MTPILILLQFGALIFMLKTADGVAKQNLALRWAQTRHSVMVQRQTVLGLWIPYGKTSFGDIAAAQEWIDSELAKHRQEVADRFGPVSKA